MYKNYLTPRNIFIAAISAAFIAVSLTVALLSVNIYETVNLNSARQDLTKTAHYLTEKIRKSDGNVIRTAALGGTTPALVIESYRDGIYYESWFFADDGALKEVTLQKGKEVLSEKGETIMAAESADFVMLTDTLLELRLVTGEKEVLVTNLYLPGYEGGLK